MKHGGRSVKVKDIGDGKKILQIPREICINPNVENYALE